MESVGLYSDCYGRPAMTVRCFLWIFIIIINIEIMVKIFFFPRTENDCEASMTDTDKSLTDLLKVS